MSIHDYGNKIMAGPKMNVNVSDLPLYVSSENIYAIVEEKVEADH